MKSSCSAEDKREKVCLHANTNIVVCMKIPLKRADTHSENRIRGMLIKTTSLAAVLRK